MNGDMDGTAADWANAGVDNLKRRVDILESAVRGLLEHVKHAEARLRELEIKHG